MNDFYDDQDLVGALSDFFVVDDRISAVFWQNRSQIASKLGASELIPQGYQTQVVSGANYRATGTADGRNFTAVFHEALTCDVAFI